MQSWAAYKYVVSLNGKAVSNSIQQLLTLGSCVFVESNGCERCAAALIIPRTRTTFLTHSRRVPKSAALFADRSWFSGALKPYEHYIPFWERDGKPEDIVAAFEWARQDEKRAHTIAEAGAQFARVHLGAEGRRCYWRALWRALGEVQPYFEEAVRTGRREL
eukprot:205474-Prymnesium_polylepis.1